MSLSVPVSVLDLAAMSLREVNQRGVSVLLVEQNAHLALSLAHHVYVLETGEIVLGGPCKDLMQDERIRRAYFGEEAL